ncbi:hypothetical protein ACM66B_001571 [Microbotryomycetes sp. NB124-2]
MACVDARPRPNRFNDLLPDPKRKALDRDAQGEIKKAKTEAARAVLARTFGAQAVAKLGSSSATSSKAASTKVSPVIALMKLKQRAKPVDVKAKDVKMEDRLFLTVELREGPDATLTAERDLYLTKVRAKLPQSQI